MGKVYEILKKLVKTVPSVNQNKWFTEWRKTLIKKYEGFYFIE